MNIKISQQGLFKYHSLQRKTVFSEEETDLYYDSLQLKKQTNGNDMERLGSSSHLE